MSYEPPMPLANLQPKAVTALNELAPDRLRDAARDAEKMADQTGCRTASPRVPDVVVSDESRTDPTPTAAFSMLPGEHTGFPVNEE